MNWKNFRLAFEGNVNAGGVALRVVALLGLLLAFVMLLSQGASAQLPTGTILGVVKDSSGAVVPGATVTVQSTETNQTRTATTDSSGSYRVNALPVGHYVIKIEHTGFRTETQTGLNLEVGQEAVIDVALEVGTSEQTVQVTGEAQQVNTTNSTLGGVVSEQTISDLPLNGRNYVDLTLLQPGITQHKNMSNSGGNQPGTVFSSNGAPFQSNSYMLDGASLINTFGVSGASGTGNTLGVDGIREYKVVTNNQSAEYGMTMGSQTVLVSKSGTNSFHGTGFEFLRNQVLDAANYYDVPTAANGFKRTPEFRRNNFGGALGGPARKDKTFFHVAYEGLRESIGQTIVSGTIPSNCFGLTNNPCATGGTVAASAAKFLPFFPKPNILLPNLPLVGSCTVIGKCGATYPFSVPITENWGQGRLDHTFSSADTAFARYTFDDSYFQQGLGYQPFTQTQGTRSQFVTLSENHVFSAGLLNTARFSFSRTAAHINSESDFAPFDFNMIAGQTAPGMGTIQITNITSSTVAAGIGPASTKPTYPIQNIFTWSDDLFWVKGKHSFKFGTLINHYQQNLFRFSNTRGAFKSSSIQQFLAGSFSTVSVNLFPNLAAAKRYYNNDTIGFYAQDDFKVLPNLTLNLGLRYEMATVVSDSHGLNLRADPTCAYPCAQIGQLYDNPSLHNFGPRIGFAWDVMGDGKTSVRGGGALMYDIETLGETLSGGIGQPPFGAALSLGTTSFVTLPINVGGPNPTDGTTVGTGGVNFHLKQPKLYQWNLTVERQLPWTMALQVSYVGSRGIHLLQAADSNPYPFTIQNGQPFWDPGTILPSSDPKAVHRLTNPTWGNFPAGGSGDSIYHALEFGVTKRVSHGLQFQSSYTYSKLIDDGDGQAPSQTTSSSPTEISVLDLRLDRGLASFDARHNYRFNTIYNLPTTGASNSLVRGVLNGWWAAAIFSAQSGTPFSPSISNDRSRSSGIGNLSDLTRPDWAPGRNPYNATHGGSSGCTLGSGSSAVALPAGTPLGSPSLFFDPCAFLLTPLGYMGNVGRNSLIGPGLLDLDFSLVKDTSVKWLGEAGKVEFRAEFFNIMNHPNFAQPARTVFTGLLTTGTNCAVTGCPVGTENPQTGTGIISSTASGTTQTQAAGNSRQIQFGLKIVF
jgi:hypothetical protein